MIYYLIFFSYHYACYIDMLCKFSLSLLLIIPSLLSCSLICLIENEFYTSHISLFRTIFILLIELLHSLSWLRVCYWMRDLTMHPFLPWRVRICRINKLLLFYPGWKIVNSFPRGLGIKLNNKAQWIVLYHDLELISNLNILKLMVFGDSRQVI